MEEARTYLTEDDDQWHIPDDERAEWVAGSPDDEPPFHLPRD